MATKSEKTDVSYKSTIQIDNTTIKRLKDFCDAFDLTKDELLNHFMDLHEPEMIEKFKNRVTQLEAKRNPLVTAPAKNGKNKG